MVSDKSNNNKQCLHTKVLNNTMKNEWGNKNSWTTTKIKEYAYLAEWLITTTDEHSRHGQCCFCCSSYEATISNYNDQDRDISCNPYHLIKNDSKS